MCVAYIATLAKKTFFFLLENVRELVTFQLFPKHLSDNPQKVLTFLRSSFFFVGAHFVFVTWSTTHTQNNRRLLSAAPLCCVVCVVK